MVHICILKSIVGTFILQFTNNFRFIPRYEREISSGSIDSGVVMNSSQISNSSTPEISNSTDPTTAYRQSN